MIKLTVVDNITDNNWITHLSENWLSSVKTVFNNEDKLLVDLYTLGVLKTTRWSDLTEKECNLLILKCFDYFVSYDDIDISKEPFASFVFLTSILLLHMNELPSSIEIIRTDSGTLQINKLSTIMFSYDQIVKNNQLEKIPILKLVIDNTEK